MCAAAVDQLKKKKNLICYCQRRETDGVGVGGAGVIYLRVSHSAHLAGVLSAVRASAIETTPSPVRTRSLKLIKLEERAGFGG